MSLLSLNLIWETECPCVFWVTFRFGTFSPSPMSSRRGAWRRLRGGWSQPHCTVKKRWGEMQNKTTHTNNTQFQKCECRIKCWQKSVSAVSNNMAHLCLSNVIQCNNVYRKWNSTRLQHTIVGFRGEGHFSTAPTACVYCLGSHLELRKKSAMSANERTQNHKLIYTECWNEILIL